jgi:hypothetical protein
MVWGVISGALAYFPTLCLKYVVLCMANALLATGWLLAVSLLVMLSVVHYHAFLLI